MLTQFLNMAFKGGTLKWMKAYLERKVWSARKMFFFSEQLAKTNAFLCQHDLHINFFRKFNIPHKKS